MRLPRFIWFNALCGVPFLVCLALSAQEPLPESASAPPPPSIPSVPSSPAIQPPSPTPPPRSDGRGGDGRRRNRSGTRPPQDTLGDNPNAPAPPKPADTLLGGSVPALWDIPRSSPSRADDNLLSVIERDSLVPPVPAKVIRYAEWLLRHYDSDADGILQTEEWTLPAKMPGTPQSIDIDADGNITLEELLRHLAVFGQDRTIHRPEPPPQFFAVKPDAGFLLFKPVAPPPMPSPTTATKPLTETPEADDLAADMTEEAMTADDKPLDDATYEEIIAGRQIPAGKKYDTPRELYKGLPAWFFFRDKDGDGQVSLVEFAPTLDPASLALFGRLDKNGDGLIGSEELRTTQAAPQTTSTP